MNIVAITPDRDQYILPLSKHLKYPLVFLRTPAWDELLKLDPIAVIFLGDWLFEQEQLIKNCKKNNIPSILLMDGTIEWKHFFENPKWSYGGHEAPYMPVLCDKIFVPGASTFRFLDFFGNHGKCEITGFPRFDHYQSIKVEVKHLNESKVIGVMSGNTAGYTPEQISQSKRLFEDIYQWAQMNSEIEVKWRLRKGFEKILDVPVKNDNAGDLMEFLGKVDAVVCQPSTAAYEAMLMDLPTALADYSIAPNYMHAAWEIRGSEQIDPVMKSLISPEPLKTTLQQLLLNDTLAFRGNSATIAANLINDIIVFSKNNPGTTLPANMFMNYLDGQNKTSQINGSLFTNQSVYHFDELDTLKASYTRLESKTQKLSMQIQRRTPGFWMERLISKILK